MIAASSDTRIHGDGSKFAALPEYGKLKNEHARFHSAAANVVDAAHAGKVTSEETALGSNSEYATASRNVVTAILALKKKMPG